MPKHPPVSNRVPRLASSTSKRKNEVPTPSAEAPRRFRNGSSSQLITFPQRRKEVSNPSARRRHNRFQRCPSPARFPLQCQSSLAARFSCSSAPFSGGARQSAARLWRAWPEVRTEERGPDPQCRSTLLFSRQRQLPAWFSFHWPSFRPVVYAADLKYARHESGTVLALNFTGTRGSHVGFFGCFLRGIFASAGVLLALRALHG